MKPSRIAQAVPCVLVILVACSSGKGTGVVTETMPTAPPVEAAAPDAAADAATVVDPPKKDAAVTPPPPVGECAAETMQTACVTCCSNKHESGAAVYFTALIDCMCLAANCAKECAPTICDPALKNPDAACNACMSGKNAACNASVSAACAPDADCVAFNACVGDSGCQGKSN